MEWTIKHDSDSLHKSEEQEREQLKFWDNALSEHAARWLDGESLAPTAKHPHPVDFEDAKMKCVERHNQLRARHTAPPLEWSDELAKHAHVIAKAANDRYHSKKESKPIEALRGHGQNAFLSATTDVSFADAIDGWYAEIDNYNFEWLVKVQKWKVHEKEGDEPDWDFAGHRGSVDQFLQIIAKNAKHVGIAKAGNYIIAKYDPPLLHFNKHDPPDTFMNVSAITIEGKLEAMAEGVKQASSGPMKASQKKPVVEHFHHRHSMSVEEQTVRELFKKADKNKDGVLSAEELEDIMERLGMARKDTKRLLAAADQDKDGVLCMDEFLGWLFSESKTAKIAMEYATG